MEKTKKVFPFVLAAALATSPFLNVPKAFAVSDLSVKADDTYKAGDDSDYTLEFTIDEDLDSGDTITIEFDSDFDIDSNIDEGDIRVNGKEPDSVDFDSRDNAIEIEVPRDYNSDTEMKVTIKNVITNPDDDGEYDVTVYSENDDDEDTDTVEITNTGGGGSGDDFPVTIGDYVEGKKTSYTIGEISLDSGLSEGEWITVTFPNADMLPGGMDKNDIKINGYHPTSVKISEKNVKVKVPRGVEGDDTLTLEFAEDASINNPSVRTNYSIDVEYDGDTYTSAKFDIEKGSSQTSFPVTLSNALTGAYSSYTFAANFGKYRLRPYGILTVEFPSSDMVPSRISTSDVKVNGLVAKKVTVSGNKVKITGPSKMFADNDVNVEFTSNAHITNPRTSGAYRVKMSVTGKTLTSDSFSIYSANGVTTAEQ